MLRLTILIVALVVSQSLSAKLPSTFSKCHIQKPKLDSCILKALNALKSRPIKGDAEIQLPSFIPFVVPKFDVIQRTPIGNYSANVWNFTVHGLDTFDIKEISYDPATMTFHAKIKFDSITYETGYDISGEILSVPLKGKGIQTADLGLGRITATVKIPGKMVNHGNFESYSPTGLKIKIFMDDVSFYFDGLFGQNKELERMTNRILNSGSTLVAELVTPAFETIFENALLKHTKTLAKIVLENVVLSGSN